MKLYQLIIKYARQLISNIGTKWTLDFQTLLSRLVKYNAYSKLDTADTDHNPFYTTQDVSCNNLKMNIDTVLQFNINYTGNSKKKILHIENIKDLFEQRTSRLNNPCVIYIDPECKYIMQNAYLHIYPKGTFFKRASILGFLVTGLPLRPFCFFFSSQFCRSSESISRLLRSRSLHFVFRRFLLLFDWSSCVSLCDKIPKADVLFLLRVLGGTTGSDARGCIVVKPVAIGTCPGLGVLLCSCNHLWMNRAPEWWTEVLTDRTTPFRLTAKFHRLEQVRLKLTAPLCASLLRELGLPSSLLLLFLPSLSVSLPSSSVGMLPVWLVLVSLERHRSSCLGYFQL